MEQGARALILALRSGSKQGLGRPTAVGQVSDRRDYRKVIQPPSAWGSSSNKCD